MKKIFTILVFIATIAINAQAPQGFNYQATVRNNSGQLLLNQNVLVKFNILQNSTTGTIVYSETQTVNTDDLGQIHLVIGQGTATTGTFSAINWGSGNYYMGIELNSGNGYVAMGTTQLLSVPYALYAANTNIVTPTLQQVLDSGNATNTTLTKAGQASLLINTDGGNIGGSNFIGIKSQINGTDGYNGAIYALSNGLSKGINLGLASHATNSEIENIGVYARGYSLTGNNDNTGIQGNADGAINGKDNRGTNGYANGITPTGKNYGITGWASGSEVFNVAVGAYSELGTTTNGNNYGVSARASSITTTGTNYGIYSEASNGAFNYAGFFNGNVTITGTLVQPSDKKLKKEIKPFTAALDKIKAMKPVTYYYKTEKESGIDLPKDLQHGFIAQDIETIFPELVTTQVLNFSTTGKSGANKSSVNPDETAIDKKNKSLDVSIEKNSKVEFKGINYSGLISVLTEAIKEQQVLIEGLKSQNKLLAKRIHVVENKLKMK